MFSFEMQVIVVKSEKQRCKIIVWQSYKQTPIDFQANGENKHTESKKRNIPNLWDRTYRQLLTFETERADGFLRLKPNMPMICDV